MERYSLVRSLHWKKSRALCGEHVIDGSIVPVLMGSGVNCQGFKTLLQVIDRYLPTRTN